MTIGLTGIAGLEAEMRDRLADKSRQIASLRDELATAEAVYLQFRVTHAEMCWAGVALYKGRTHI